MASTLEFSALSDTSDLKIPGTRDVEVTFNLDPSGPAAGKTVNWTSTNGGKITASSLTNSQGKAKATFTAEKVGTFQISANVTNPNLTATHPPTITVVAADPPQTQATLTFVTPATTPAYVGEPLIAKVKLANGATGISGRDVTWTVTGGVAKPSVIKTDANGEASVEITPTAKGDVSVSVRAGDVASASPLKLPAKVLKLISVSADKAMAISSDSTTLTGLKPEQIVEVDIRVTAEDGTPPAEGTLIRVFPSPNGAMNRGHIFDANSADAALVTSGGYYHAKLNAAGVARVKLIAADNVIYNFNAIIGDDQMADLIVFISPNAGQEKAPSPAGLGAHGELDVDKLATSTITVHIPKYSQASAHDTIHLFVNNAIVKAKELERATEVDNLTLTIPANKIVNGDNTMFYMVTDAAGNGRKSASFHFKGVGATQRDAEPDPILERELEAPTIDELPANSEINHEFIRGGINISIPVYSKIAKDDKVTVTLYLNGYTADVKHSSILTLPSPAHPVTEEEVKKGFKILIPQSELEGYDSNHILSEPGHYYVEYKATDDKGVIRYSKFITGPIDTVPPGN